MRSLGKATTATFYLQIAEGETRLTTENAEEARRLQRNHNPQLSAPDLARGIDHELELAPLLVQGEQVARGDGSEAALSAEREIFEWDEMRGFVNAPAQVVRRFKLWKFRGDKPQHNAFAARHQPQRFEAAGALGIVFQQEVIHVECAKKFFGDGVVAALGVPAAATIAAADVDRCDDLVPRDFFQQRVVSGNGFLEFLIRIQAVTLEPAALDRIEIVRIKGRVKLDVGDAFSDEPFDFVAHDFD